MAAGSTGKGVVLATAGEQCTYADMYELQPRIGRPFTYPLFALAEGRHQPQLDLHEEATARGAQVWPQVTPRPLTMQFTMDSPFSLNVSGVFAELMDQDREARIAAYRDPEWQVPGGGGPRAGPDEAALGDLRDLRVGTVPRAGGSARR